MKKLIFLSIVAAVMIAAFLCTLPAEAMYHASRGCKMCKGGSSAGKIELAADRILSNKDKLELNEGQITQIRHLVRDVKKETIKMNADIETLKVEINTLMWEAPFNVDQVNSLVAEKHKLKHQKAMYLVKSHDKLYRILTVDQLKKLNTL